MMFESAVPPSLPKKATLLRNVKGRALLVASSSVHKANSEVHSICLHDLFAATTDSLNVKYAYVLLFVSVFLNSNCLN